MMVFSEFIEELELIDPPVIGGLYNWSPSTYSMETSRMAVFCSPWNEMIVLAQATTKISYFCLLPSFTQMHSVGSLEQLLFQILNAWMKSKGFVELIDYGGFLFMCKAVQISSSHQNSNF